MARTKDLTGLLSDREWYAVCPFLNVLPACVIEPTPSTSIAFFKRYMGMIRYRRSDQIEASRAIERTCVKLIAHNESVYLSVRWAKGYYGYFDMVSTSKNRDAVERAC